MTPKDQQRESRVVWFEIPSLDFGRAIGFYENILQTSIKREFFGPTELAIFPYQAPAISGAITPPEDAPAAGKDGVVIYLNADPSLDAVLARVTAAGGRILQARTDLPPGMGCFAKIADTEGNTIGLHAVA
jgi:predicted enzyme related to lactoylglutathione lyase